MRRGESSYNVSKNSIRSVMNKTLSSKKPIDRVDAVQKVTGTAKFSAEYDFPGIIYGVLAESTIARGTISGIDTKAAENAPGVLAVITHLNCPKLPGYESTAADIAKRN